MKILEYIEVPKLDRVEFALPYFEKLADELS